MSLPPRRAGARISGSRSGGGQITPSVRASLSLRFPSGGACAVSLHGVAAGAAGRDRAQALGSSFGAAGSSPERSARCVCARSGAAARARKATRLRIRRSAIACVPSLSRTTGERNGGSAPRRGSARRLLAEPDQREMPERRHRRALDHAACRGWRSVQACSRAQSNSGRQPSRRATGAKCSSKARRIPPSAPM